MHVSVLKKEVLKYLEPKPNENFIDATFGFGGHSLDILEENGPKGKVLGIELDRELYKKGIERKIDRLLLVNDSYINLKTIAEENDFKPFGILMDIGFSSWHLEQSGRGFSFKKDEPLDMRYDTSSILTAEQIVNQWSQMEIEKVLKEYGEERFSKKISRTITEQRKIRPVTTTLELVELIKRSVPSWYQRRKIHFATKTFQALRIAVNNELNNLKETLPQALEVLEKGGRLVVISFHSLEDRIVKNFFKNNKSLNVLTKKPIGPTKQEIISNPRSRSAKLRAAVKIQ